MAPRRIILAGGLIALAGLLAYSNSFTGPLVLDDLASIAGNPTIRHFGTAFFPPPREGITVSGRPVLNLSLALNWALSGPGIWTYHAVNLLIHLLAALALFGILRRTLLRTAGEEGALWIAWAAALIWTVHPLQTESVTYIIQRAESLMGLFYLLTLYCFIRFSDETLTRSAPLGRKRFGFRSGARPRFGACWAAASVAFCLLGMGTKEVMVSAPVMVFLYDRVFVAGSFGEAWRRRRGYYLALAATWIPLACLVLSTGNRGGTSGAGIGVGPWTYWQTQFPAVLSYLKLAFWPSPLVFDYGTEWVRNPLTVLPAAAAVLLLVAGAVWLWRKRPAWGYAALFFFAILAPSGLIPGNRQTMAEQRMYLALAPLAAAAAVAIARRWLACERRQKEPLTLIFTASALALSLGSATFIRNDTYRTSLALYRDNVAKKPGNAYAHDNLGLALASAGRLPEAIAQHRMALALDPDSAPAHNNLGIALSDLGKEEEAIVHYAAAVRLRPSYAEACSNLGQALARTGHLREAEACLRRALDLKPGLAQAHLNLGSVLATAGRPGPAEAEFEEALRLDPGYADAENNLGYLLFQQRRPGEALPHVQAALRLRPDNAEAHLNLANILAVSGHRQESVAEYRRALQLRPNYPAAHYDLALVLRALGRLDEAAEEMARANAARPQPARP